MDGCNKTNKIDPYEGVNRKINTIQSFKTGLIKQEDPFYGSKMQLFA
ncbi:hypothetical protein PAENIP36_08720 [Paenibacillus sp. P36]